MVIKNKKGYMKTLEAVIAVIILISFLLALLPREEAKPETPQDIQLLQDTVFTTIQNDNYYRACVLSNNLNCITSFINSTFPYTLEFDAKICDLTSCPEPDLPDKSVYVSDLIISSNLTEFDTRLLRLFIWRKI